MSNTERAASARRTRGAGRTGDSSSGASRLQFDGTGFAVLLGLRLGGFADTASLAARVGWGESEVEAEARGLAGSGLVARRDGLRPGWSLTPAGRLENERLLASQLDAAGHRALVEDTHRRFLALNPRLLALCTTWQVVDAASGTLNDHTDPDRDRPVIDGLLALDREAQEFVGPLGDALDRFAHYGPRLAAAAAKVDAGDHRWFEAPLIDSYHTVWFELHENLLATLGLDRTSEAPSGA